MVLWVQLQPAGNQVRLEACTEPQGAAERPKSPAGNPGQPSHPLQGLSWGLSCSTWILGVEIGELVISLPVSPRLYNREVSGGDRREMQPVGAWEQGGKGCSRKCPSGVRRLGGNARGRRAALGRGGPGLPFL